MGVVGGGREERAYIEVGIGFDTIRSKQLRKSNRKTKGPHK